MYCQISTSWHIFVNWCHDGWNDHLQGRHNLTVSSFTLCFILCPHPQTHTPSLYDQTNRNAVSYLFDCMLHAVETSLRAPGSRSLIISGGYFSWMPPLVPQSPPLRWPHRWPFGLDLDLVVSFDIILPLGLTLSDLPTPAYRSLAVTHYSPFCFLRVLGYVRLNSLAANNVNARITNPNWRLESFGSIWLSPLICHTACISFRSPRC